MKAQRKNTNPEIKDFDERYQPPTYAPDLALPIKPFQLKVFELSWRSPPHPGDEVRVKADKAKKVAFDHKAEINNEALQKIRLQKGLQATAAELEQVLNDKRRAMPPPAMRPPKYTRYEEPEEQQQDSQESEEHSWLDEILKDDPPQAAPYAASSSRPQVQQEEPEWKQLRDREINEMRQGFAAYSAEGRQYYPSNKCLQAWYGHGIEGPVREQWGRTNIGWGFDSGYKMATTWW